MTVDLAPLESASRLLIEAVLSPVQGRRFQPTGFPDLGAATYVLPDDTPMLLVESAQSMANRLENTAWDLEANDLVAPMRGVPFVRVVDKRSGSAITDSIREAHRLNSPYILEMNDDYLAKMKAAFVTEGQGAVDLSAAARTCFRFDPNAVLHGLFLAKKELAGGRIRLQRLLTSFIEAERAVPAESGGVKNDRVNPSGDTSSGYGNVPFHRTEFVAARTIAYFNLDLAALRAYRIGKTKGPGGLTGGGRLLALIALYKIRSLLDGGLRLRTACDLETKEIRVTRPQGFVFPTLDALAKELPAAVAACKAEGLFAEEDELVVKIDASSIKSKKEEAADADAEG